MAQFTSEYGNTAILAESGGSGAASFGAGLRFAAVGVMLLAPTLVLIGGWVGYLRWRRPHWAMLAVPDGAFAVPKRRGGKRLRHRRSRVPVRCAAVALEFGVGLPMTAWGMSLPDYAPQHRPAGGAVAGPVRHPPADEMPATVGWSLDDLKAVFAQVLAEDRAAAVAAASAVTAPVDEPPAEVDVTVRMGELIAQFSGMEAPTAPAEAPPEESSPTACIGDLISEFSGKQAAPKG